MINYVVLMEEKEFIPQTYFSFHWYKKGLGNEIPIFSSAFCTIKEARNELEKADFSNIEHGFTIEEIILNDIAQITIFFFDASGQYERSGIYRRTIS